MNNLKIRTHIENGVTYWQVSDIAKALYTSSLNYSIKKSGITLKKFSGKSKYEHNYIDAENFEKLITHMKESKKMYDQGVQLQELYNSLTKNVENSVHSEAEDVFNFINSVVQEGHPTNIKPTAEILPKDDSIAGDSIEEDTQPQNQLQVITEQEVLGKEFRIYGDFDNPLFLARDVAGWIEHSDPPAMLKVIDDDEKVKLLTPRLLVGGLQANTEYWFLTEDGLYEVLMQSRKPIAKQFKKEVKKILKTIRKTGGYIPVYEGDTETEILSRAVLIGKRIMEEQKQKIAQLEEINTELTTENENQKQTNLVLTKQVQEWEKKNAVRKLMNSFAHRKCGDDYKYAYNILYKELRYKKGICLSQRKPLNSKKSLLATIRDNEWDDVLQVAGALCVSVGLNIKSILNPVNAEKVPV